MPTGWTVTFSPAQVALAAGDETDIAVTIDPAPGFTGTIPFNVHVFYGNQYAGGVTVYVQKI